MWVLILTLLFYSDPAEGKFSPSISSVVFKSKGSCEAAKSADLSEFKPIADRLNKIASDEAKVGQIKGPAQVVVSAICVAQ